MKTLINSRCINRNMELSLQMDESLEKKIRETIVQAQNRSRVSGKGIDLVPPPFQPLYSIVLGEIITYWVEKNKGTVVTRSRPVEMQEFLEWLYQQAPDMSSYVLTSLQSFNKLDSNESRPILY